MDERMKLLLLNDLIGARFGTEDFSVFLYSLVCMQAPVTVVELGTGLGLSALWMALAAKRNKKGRVWTVDDFEYFDKQKPKVEEVIAKLRDTNFVALENSTAEEYYSQITRLFDLDPYLTFVNSKMILNEIGHFSRYPFAGKPIDLLFSDFAHDPVSVLAILGHFLPCMGASSSIFIHSASTFWPSYLLLEQLVAQLNALKVPKLLQDYCSIDLSGFVKHHRITLIHLTECKDRSRQNSAAWLKIEPIDILPYPKSIMQGMGREAISRMIDG